MRQKHAKGKVMLKVDCWRGELRERRELWLVEEEVHFEKLLPLIVLRKLLCVVFQRKPNFLENLHKVPRHRFLSLSLYSLWSHQNGFLQITRQEISPSPPSTKLSFSFQNPLSPHSPFCSTETNMASWFKDFFLKKLLPSVFCLML